MENKIAFLNSHLIGFRQALMETCEALLIVCDLDLELGVGMNDEHFVAFARRKGANAPMISQWWQDHVILGENNNVKWHMEINFSAFDLPKSAKTSSAFCSCGFATSSGFALLIITYYRFKNFFETKRLKQVNNSNQKVKNKKNKIKCKIAKTPQNGKIKNIGTKSGQNGARRTRPAWRAFPRTTTVARCP